MTQGNWVVGIKIPFDLRLDREWVSLLVYQVIPEILEDNLVLTYVQNIIIENKGVVGIHTVIFDELHSKISQTITEKALHQNQLTQMELEHYSEQLTITFIRLIEENLDVMLRLSDDDFHIVDSVFNMEKPDIVYYSLSKWDS